MIEIKDKKDCCGCWSCANICPKHCIEMVEDDEGFRYPVVDESICVDCGLCEKACPVLNADNNDEPKEQQGWLVQHKDDKIRQESTSGGAFTAIASYVLKNGGVVFGAGYRKGTFVVTHQAVENEVDLSIFRNSKYVQSEVGDCYTQALRFLKEGRLVLFSGTPCQIEGFIHFLNGKKFDNLILQDVVCRGVPSPGILSSYISMQQKLIGGKFEKILFRDKFHGYHYSSFSIYNEDKNKDYHKGIDSNEYLRSFFDNLNDRPSCYDCRFKKRYRKSDITLWDCFPIEKFTDKLDGKGTTRVLVHTKKGAEIINAVMKDLNAVSVNTDSLTDGVREMFKSVPYNPKRQQFFEDFKEMDSVAFFKKWFPITLKVRLNSFVRLTCHRLGIYTLAKRVFLKFYTRKDERTKKI
ncbi:MAG: Coenzyme F420 hydrogenase/dehydrogenase, beta subunit C-terminal domain [Bacteroidales bacterium]|nr:Coenzyme F420 hydrogenase/dehydrogenase, beta subunit C-terminal domain [Bacteroidales bacterium]